MQHLLAIKVPNFSKIYRSKQYLQWFLWGYPKTLQFQVFVSNVIHKDLKLKFFAVILQKPL